MKKKGISLIALAITVIVLAILSGAILLVSSPKNPVKQAREKTYKADLQSLDDRLAEKIGSLEQADEIDGDMLYVYGKEADEYIPGIPQKYQGTLGIEAGKLVVLQYNSIGDEIEEDQKKWAEEAGYKVVPKYYDPIVPAGFTSLSAKTDWNKGFIIKDSRGNEYVWVPAMSLKKEYQTGRQALDGEYSKCFGTRDYSDYKEMLTNIKSVFPSLTNLKVDDTFAKVTGDTTLDYTDMVENVEKYGGFYIARYEIGSDYTYKKYNGPYSTMTAGNVSNVFNTYFTSNAYTSVVPTIPTQSHYDTILAWFESSGAKSKNVIQVSSRSVGNYFFDGLKYRTSDASDYLDKEKNRSQVILTGSAEKTYVNAIADLAGNYPEIVQGNIESASTSTNTLLRGGAVWDTTAYKMAMSNITVENSSYSMATMRAVLYIK